MFPKFLYEACTIKPNRYTKKEFIDQFSEWIYVYAKFLNKHLQTEFKHTSKIQSVKAKLASVQTHRDNSTYIN